LLADCTTSNGSTRDRETALIFAAAMGSVELVQALLDRGADINAKTNLGATALRLAAAQHHRAIVQLLRARGAE
jgi:ankyrin repeat protein